MPLAKQWEILFDKPAAENPKAKSKAHFVSFEFHRLEHSTIISCAVVNSQGFQTDSTDNFVEQAINEELKIQLLVTNGHGFFREVAKVFA